MEAGSRDLVIAMKLMQNLGRLLDRYGDKNPSWCNNRSRLCCGATADVTNTDDKAVYLGVPAKKLRMLNEDLIECKRGKETI